MNLVGSTDPDALRIHVDDALAAAQALPRDARVVDLGSGAGLPGIPLALARPDLDLVLVEIRERRVHFLRHVVRTLELGIEVRRADFRTAPDEAFDIALARAVSPVPEILPLAAGWVGPDGEIWVWTRLSAAEAGAPEADSIALASDRGHILRVPAAAVSRGTLP
jgi:16S rRNA (guanine527-N7)-methyltransferase